MKSTPKKEKFTKEKKRTVVPLELLVCVKVYKRSIHQGQLTALQYAEEVKGTDHKTMFSMQVTQ